LIPSFGAFSDEVFPSTTWSTRVAAIFSRPRPRGSSGAFDAATGTRLRTLKNATGEWASLGRGCRTHALIPTSDGGAIAIAIDDLTYATAAKFTAPP
jgi:hypothetical protein